MICYTKISRDGVGEVWPHIEEWVRISRGADESYSVEDIKAVCESGKCDLWVATLDDAYKGFLVGVTSIRPQGKVYHGSWLGGEDLAIWVDGLKFIEDFVRENGYIGSSFIGRKAWKRLVGYDYEGVYYYKKLN